MLEYTCEVTTESGQQLKLRYATIKSLINTGDGIFTTYGISCCARSPDGKCEEAIILDILPELSFVEALVKTFCNGKLLPVHLHDLVADSLA